MPMKTVSNMSSLHSARGIAFVALMAALGNVMFILSSPILPATQVALDLSHIGTFIAAIFGGPWIGLVTGLLVGLSPGFYFGYAGGNLGLLGLIGLPLGKAMTGLTVGYMAKAFGSQTGKHASWKVLAIVLISYVPESIFTAVYFKALIPMFAPASIVPDAVVLVILTKAWGEIAIMSFIMGALVGNAGFATFIRQHFAQIPKPTIIASALKTQETAEKAFKTYLTDEDLPTI